MQMWKVPKEVSLCVTATEFSYVGVSKKQPKVGKSMFF